MLSKLNFKKRVCKKYWYSKKNVHHWIQTRDLLNASQLLYPLSHMAVVFDGMLLEFSPLLRLAAAVEHNLITAFTRGDKLEVGGWLICRGQQSQVSYRRDGQTDRQTDGFSALYIDTHHFWAAYFFHQNFCLYGIYSTNICNNYSQIRTYSKNNLVGGTSKSSYIIGLERVYAQCTKLHVLSR